MPSQFIRFKYLLSATYKAMGGQDCGAQKHSNCDSSVTKQHISVTSDVTGWARTLRQIFENL
jgi:hypothetical protein